MSTLGSVQAIGQSFLSPPDLNTKRIKFNLFLKDYCFFHEGCDAGPVRSSGCALPVLRFGCFLVQVVHLFRDGIDLVLFLIRGW